MEIRRMDALRARCLSGETLIGSFVAIPHPVAVEVMALSGFDFLCIDAEHAQIGRSELENLVRAADVHGVPAMVRVAGHAPEGVAAALDAGAAGVLVPRVSSAAQARSAAEAARFPPEGRRGVGPGRASGYGYRIPDLLRRAAVETLVAVQVETVEGLREASAIAAVPGVDLVFVGPGDLSVSLRAQGEGDADELEAAIHSIVAAARGVGKPAGIFSAAAQDVARRAAAGASFFLLASDTMLLGGAARQAAHAALG